MSEIYDIIEPPKGMFPITFNLIAGTTNPGVTWETDNPLKGICNPIPRNLDNLPKGIRNLVPNRIQI